MRLLIWMLCSAILFSSCSVENREIPTLEVGQDFTDSNVRVVTIDTFTVALSTFKFDSINTSASNRLLVGGYQDVYFGRVFSEPYFELSAIDYDIPLDAELDSIALILGYDRYFYNDTTQIAEINIHRLLEDVNASDDIFYNTTQLEFDSIPLTSRRFFPEPVDEDSLHIQIPLDFGQELFDLIQDNDINSDQEVRERFNGLTIRNASEGNAAVVGFTRDPESTYLRFFYSIPGEFEDDEGAFDLFINQNVGLPRAYNRIQSDVLNTPLDTLTDQEINLPSALSQNLSFIQSGTGYATRIEFPTLKDIGQIPGTGTVLEATLELRPPTSSFSDDLPIRDSLNVQIVDPNNVITQTIVNGNGAVRALINQENEEFNDLFYQIPLVTYLDQELSQVPEIEDAVVIYPNNYNATVDRIVLQGDGNNSFRAKLILTYAIYDE